MLQMVLIPSHNFGALIVVIFMDVNSENIISVAFLNKVSGPRLLYNEGKIWNSLCQKNVSTIEKSRPLVDLIAVDKETALPGFMRMLVH